MIKVLFVCLGNICRSPMAEFVFKNMVNKKDSFFRIVLNKLKGGQTGLIEKPKWTKETVFEESKKYNTRNSFRKGSSAYRVALNNGWLDEMTWLKPDVKWTKEKVFIEAQKYSYIVDFKNNVANVNVNEIKLENISSIKNKDDYQEVGTDKPIGSKSAIDEN